MSEEFSYTIPTEPEQSPTRRFPVVRQLLILALLLGGIFTIGFGAHMTSMLTNNDSSAPAPLQQPQRDIASAYVPIPNLENISLIAEAAFVLDVNSQRVLYSKSPDTVLPIASITKLMTALVAHELVTDETPIVIPREAALQESRSGLIPGERFTKQALADYAVIASSNDAAYSLATVVGAQLNADRPYQSFVESMNIRAEELSLPTLEFRNPTGLDISPTEAGAFGSARDITFLVQYLLQEYPSVLEPTTIASTRVYNAAGDFHDAENTNRIINTIPNLLASKTGYTDLAGGNLTIAFDAGFNRPIIITVLGSTFQGRFRDIETLVAAVQTALQTP